MSSTHAPRTSCGSGIRRANPATPIAERTDGTTSARCGLSGPGFGRSTSRACHNLGAAFTHAGFGTSQHDFGAEWREIALLTFDGNLIDRCELFDEDALDDALATFDQLAASVAQIENAATRANELVAEAVTARGLRNVGPADRDFARVVLLFDKTRVTRMEALVLIIAISRSLVPTDSTVRDAN